MAGFGDIKGQELVTEHFKNAIKLNKISHAYILNGEQGMGKKTMANAFALTLMCEEGGEEPCMNCHACRQAMSFNHPDIRYVTHDKPGVISVEEVRQQINSDVQIKPYSSKYKIYIIDEAEKMNTAAQNAILKTIEEPPAYVVILLLTSNKDMLLSTILSRCVTMEFKPVRRDILINYLVEKEKLPDYRAREVADFAGGNIGKAINMAGSDDFMQMKDDVVRLMKNVRKMTAADISDAVQEIGTYKDRLSEYLDMVLMWYRDVLMYKASGDESRIVYKDNIDIIREQAKIASYSGIEKVLREIDSLKGKLKINVNFDILIELLVLTMRDCVKKPNSVY